MVFELTGTTVVVSAATLWSVYKAICWLMDRYQIGRKRKDYHLLQKSNKIMMRQMIRDAHREYMAAGVIDEDELEHLEDVYSVYHSLGGNSSGDRWMKEIRKLPRK